MKPYKQIFQFKEKLDGLRESQLKFHEKWNKGICGESFTVNCVGVCDELTLVFALIIQTRSRLII